MNSVDMITWVDEASNEELAPVMEALATRLYRHRHLHRGFTPQPLFNPSIGIGGTYPCIEVVIRIFDAEGNFLGFALKKRTAKNDPWQGQYHIVGTAVRPSDSFGRMFHRLAYEIYGAEGHGVSLQAAVASLGNRLHDEPERRATCFTSTYQLDISEGQAEFLDGEWKTFALDFHVPEIVDHHRQALVWAANPNRRHFIDVHT